MSGHRPFGLLRADEATRRYVTNLETEVERLLAQLVVEDERNERCALENERLRARETTRYVQLIEALGRVGVEPSLEEWHEGLTIVRRLRARNGRLRKAVNWLRGALHEETHKGARLYNEYGTQLDHVPTVDDCEVWECQRAREILAENKDEVKT